MVEELAVSYTTDDLLQDVLRYMLQVCQNGGGNLSDWVTVIEARLVKEESNWNGLKAVDCHGVERVSGLSC